MAVRTMRVVWQKNSGLNNLVQRHQQPQSPGESQSTGQPNHQNWREDPFIGIWEDREDMQDSTQLVRTIRDSEWRS